MQSGRIVSHPALVRNRFRALASLPEEQLDLVEASLVIAQEDQPGLDIDPYLAQVGTWSDAVRARVRGRRDAESIVDALNTILFDEEGFHGEDDDYYDPKSAMVSELLDRHAGLPITLSILYLELSRRIGAEVAGIAMPGRMLVRFSGDFGTVVVDPFDGGRVLSSAELQGLLDQTYGGGVRLRETHLRSFPRRAVLARELAQLKAAYLSQHDLPHAAASIDRLLILDDRDVSEIRDRAALAMQMHSYAIAIECLERYLALVPAAEDSAKARSQIVYLRSWLDQN